MLNEFSDKDSVGGLSFEEKITLVETGVTCKISTVMYVGLL